MDALANSVKGWLSRPFKEDGNALDWFLFFGLTAVAAFLWSRIIRSLVS